MRKQATMSHSRSKPSVIVGVGASAGGIQAFQKFLKGVPSDTDAAIVLVMHLDPHRPSGLARALRPSTPLPIVEAGNGVRIEAGKIYVIVADSTLTVHDGKLHSESPRASGSPRQTIDTFLQALARDAGERAVGVVLSGTASDGAAGLKAIQEAGGQTFAQDGSAEFSGMPDAAVEAGAVDRVLAPEKIMAAVVETFGRAKGMAEPGKLAAVVERLRSESNIDFDRYKPAMLGRRIRRRMALMGVNTLDTYVEMLDDQPEELQALLQDLLINVTAFFRDQKGYEALRKHAFPEIAKADPASIRIWVPGCSTGEEAYSIAMELLDFMEETGVERTVQVFATDVDEPALTVARAAVYPPDAVKQIGEERTRRFFRRRADGTLEAKRPLRDACIFARHDLTGDPPFSKLDLISCRNVLIYLGADVQRRLMPVFQYALKEGGFLSLGPAESAAGAREMFKEVARGTHLYRRLPGAAARPAEGYTFNKGTVEGTKPERQAPAMALLQDEVDRVRLDLHAPPSIVVDEADRVLLVSGDVGNFLVPTPGRPDTTAAKMVRDELQADFESALTEARAEQGRVRRERIPFETQGGMREVTLDIMPLEGPSGPVHLVTFETPPAPAPTQRTEGDSSEVQRLRAALLAQKLHHQVVMRRLEAANEELQNTQEEFMASNEEYQSTNEELETAKEELQSSYEELTTVNDQLRAHTDELSNLYTDLENIVASLEVPLLIVGPDLAIRRVADPQGLIARIIPADIGRSLADLRVNLPGIDLAGMAKEAMRTGEVQHAEVQDRNGRWQQVRVRPYAKPNDSKAGGVIVLLDVHAQKTEALAHRRARVLAETVIATTPAPLLLLDDKMGVVTANDAFCSAFDCEETSMRGQNLFTALDGSWDIPDLKNLLKDTIQRHEGFANVQIEHPFPGLGNRILRLSGRPIPPDTDRPEMVLLTIIDETERLAAVEELDSLRTEQLERLVQLNQFKAEFIGMAAHELAGPLTPMQVQLKVIEKGGVDAAQAKALEVARRNLNAIMLLVKDMLMAARFQAGRLELGLETVELAPLVEEVAQAYRAVADEKAITIKTDLQAATVPADQHHIERVVSNLLSNAVKYTPEGGRVEVMLVTKGKEAVLRVTDTGLGLSKEDLRALFEPFKRMHEGKTNAPGTGLGLYICNGIVELHGGTLEAESAGPDQGSTFTVRLPLRRHSGKRSQGNAGAADGMAGARQPAAADVAPVG